MQKLPKAYEPKDVEKRWADFWVQKNIFVASLSSDKESYSIVIPPPNVTGSLHMGHALNVTLQDILCRFNRMCGKNVLWLPGVDHAGIATQNVVERYLLDKGIRKEDLGREKFISEVWKFKEKFGGEIVEQLKRLGASVDWSRFRFTMDPGFVRAVRKAFFELYNDGLIYRGDYIINFCPRCGTALSDLEVEHKEEDGSLYYIEYPLEGERKSVVVATTRPETMLGDTAVAVHPDDQRYAHLVGKMILLPLANRVIPLISDTYVDKEFGTGALKITPAHDFNDFEVAKRHKLDIVKIMDEKGRMNKNAGAYSGLDRFLARERVVEDLKKLGLLKKVVPYKILLGRCYRCGTVVEPYLSKQWFVRTKPLAEPAKNVVLEKKIRIIPENWENTYFEWMDNIRDWCISRQIWWGHRIPVWYCKDCGKMMVSLKDPKNCESCGSKNIFQDPDVLDTWFSSALWPFATFGWPDRTKELSIFYPTSCLVTGFDILFFWVARMIMMGLRFMGDVPFRDVYIHALVRDIEGRKMSKSRGNVIDPLVVMEKYGTDAFRFTLCAFAAQGRDIKFSEERIEGYRHFINKIWNAARFVLMNLDDDTKAEFRKEDLDICDVWILSSLQKTIKEVRKSLKEYRFNDAAQAIYQFSWYKFCDWYIEISKVHLKSQRGSTVKSVLLYTLENVIKLLHPFIPFVTEEIWEKLPGERSCLAKERFPEPDESLIDEGVEEKMEVFMDCVVSIRNIRAEMNIPLSLPLKVYIECGNDERIELLKNCSPYMMALARLSEIHFGKDGVFEKSCATSVVKDVELYVPIAGVVDFSKEEKRIKKEIAKVESDLSLVVKKLSNEDFLKKAPKEVVEKEKRSFEELNERKEKLYATLERIKSFKDGIL